MTLTTTDEALRFALEKKLCELSFYEFFQKAWHIVEPSIELSTNWQYELRLEIFVEL